MNIESLVTGIRTRLGLTRREDGSRETGDKSFSPDQAIEIAWYVYHPTGRDIFFDPVRDAVMKNTKIPEALRQTTVEEIRKRRGNTTGKPKEELAQLGNQFLVECIGNVEVGRVLVELGKRETETAMIDH